MGPRGEIITNDGEVSVVLDTEAIDGTKPLRTRMTFQAAKVRKPLLAVSSIVERGNLTVFDGKGSYIVTGTTDELKPIRDAIQAIKMKVPLREKNGVYVMNVKQPTARQQLRQPMEVEPNQGFSRPEAR